MKIEILNEWSFEELESKIRKIPLKKKDEDGNTIYPYEKANIEIRNMHPKELNPSTLYLIKKNLEFQREFRQHMISTHGIDILELEGALEIKNEQGDIWTITPPIVELTKEIMMPAKIDGHFDYSHKKIPLMLQVLMDGAHRTYHALEIDQNMNVVHLSGLSDEHPLYALPNSWEQVEEVEDTPKAMTAKKNYRIEKYYDLYRDFSVIGCGAPRHTSTG